MIPQYAYMHPDEKKQLSKYYATAHNIAKKFCEENKIADSHEIYTSAETAARLYHKNEAIQAAKSAKDFILYKIKSAYERKLKRMTHADQFKPISEETKLAIINDAKILKMSNAELTKKYGVSSSSITRILQKAGIIAPPVSRNNKVTNKNQNKKSTEPVDTKLDKDNDTAPIVTTNDSENATGTKKNFIETTRKIISNKKSEESYTQNKYALETEKTKTDDVENLSHIINHLGLMISDKLTSISIQYDLNGNNVKIKIEKPEK